MVITNSDIEIFRARLTADEKSRSTVEKYVRDIEAFCRFCKGELSKESTVLYKKRLLENGYKPRSVNSMIASVNSFLRFLGANELMIKSIKLQKQVFCPEEKELTKAEYERLCKAAKAKGNERLSLILQTICATGIRVSELEFITAQALKSGEITVSLKGKTRTVFIVSELRKKLISYCKCQSVESGPVFVTKSGKPVNRTNIWREMKALCEAAQVNPQKVFPHNLRHLFARIFYGIDKDIAKLADILGHSSIETTRIYIISTGTEHRRRMEKMRLII